jgi:uncharacterized membrane protein
MAAPEECAARKSILQDYVMSVFVAFGLASPISIGYPRFGRFDEGFWSFDCGVFSNS